MPQPTRPQLALYAAAAIAVLLIGARFLRSQDGAAGGDGFGTTAAAPAAAGAIGAADAGAALGAPDGSVAAANGGDPAGSDPAGGDPAGVDPAAAEGSLVVDVKGAVRRPGVYRLAPGARALDAVRRAGGVTRRADRLGVNLAARVADGGEVVVPQRGAGGMAFGGGATTGGGAVGGGSGSTGGGASDSGTPLALDLNTATAQELEQLDGVGPATAANIVAYREAHGGFSSIEELDEVSGIGEARLAAIRAQLGQ